MTRSNVVILDASVYPYRNELIVELTGKDRDGDFVVLSYQFEYIGPDNAVRPKQTIDDTFDDVVADALADSEYRWV